MSHRSFAIAGNAILCIPCHRASRRLPAAIIHFWLEFHTTPAFYSVIVRFIHIRSSISSIFRRLRIFDLKPTVKLSGRLFFEFFDAIDIISKTWNNIGHV